MRRALSLTLLLLAAAAPAAGAAGHSVKVRSVSAPGSAVGVNVTVARKGRTPAAGVRFYLSSDAKRDANDVGVKGSAKVAKGRRSGRSRVGATIKIPAGQPLGDFRVLACIGKSCAVSKRALTVTRTPVGTRQLVDRAVAAGKLSAQQGLVYR